MRPIRFYKKIAMLVLALAPLGLSEPAGAVEAPVAQKSTSLDQVNVTDLGDRLRVELTGGQDLQYAVSITGAPASVTLDLHGAAKGRGVQRMDVNKPPLLEIIPTEIATPSTGVKLVFRLAFPVKPDVRREATGLVIDFPKTGPVAKGRMLQQRPGGEFATEPDGPLPVTNAKRSTTPTRNARVMTKVEVQRGNAEALVKIFGDGPLRYDAKLIDQSRLVVDLLNVTSTLHRKILPVDHPLLKRIRIGHHEDRIRLVFDLPKPVNYMLQSGKNSDYIGVQLTAVGMPQRSQASRKPSVPRQPVPVQAEVGQRALSQRKGAIADAKNSGRPELIARHVGAESRKPRLAQMVAGQATATSRRATAAKQYKGRRISLDFQGADISNVLRLIAEVSGLNIVVGEGAKAKVTMKLVNVPWDQALDMLLKMNNLGMVREGNIIWIDTLSNIAKTQEAEARAQESKIKAEPLVTKVIYVQNVRAADIQATLRQHLSPRGQIQVNGGSNALVLQDTVSKVADFERLVRQLDLVAPQVEIEGRIVQADTSYTRSFGVQWGFSDLSSSSQSGKFTVVGNNVGPFNEPLQGDSTGEVTQDFLVNLPAAVEGLAPIPQVGVNAGKFLGDRFALDMRLSAGELLGLVKTLAAPKITTLDKQEAKIEQGESIPFQTTSLQGTQTTFVDANLTLQVTPQITSRDPRERNKNVLMKVKVTRNSVGERSNPAGPSIDKKEASTQVLVRNGETMVIGGIFLDDQRNSVQGVPYLSRIPVLGWLFKSKTESVSKQELLIFLTPTIVL